MPPTSKQPGNEGWKSALAFFIGLAAVAILHAVGVSKEALLVILVILIAISFSN